MSEVPMKSVDKTDKAVLLEKILVEGDLSKLTPAERVVYVNKVCEALGLNPFTKPFAFIRLNGKLVLYATKDATDQLRKVHGISVQIVDRQIVNNEVYVVTARATDKNGRTDEAIGAVSIKGLSGEALANAMMKAETKAKRRVTLSICGLGFLDESEIESSPRNDYNVPDSNSPEYREQQTATTQQSHDDSSVSSTSANEISKDSEKETIELRDVIVKSSEMIKSKKGNDVLKVTLLADIGEYTAITINKNLITKLDKNSWLSKVVLQKGNNDWWIIQSVEE